MRMFPRTLPRSQYAYALFLAGRLHASREHWLTQAKGSVEHRSLFVSYAKSSHRAYLNSLQLVRELAVRLKVAA